jgi:hypothetical protein
VRAQNPTNSGICKGIQEGIVIIDPMLCGIDDETDLCDDRCDPI